VAGAQSTGRRGEAGERIRAAGCLLADQLIRASFGLRSGNVARADRSRRAMEARRMLTRLHRIVMVGLACVFALPAQAQLLTHRDLSYAMAKTIAETAIESCGAKGYAVSAVVVDRAGETIVALRADNAGPTTMENARRKAYTARSFRVSTASYAKRFADNDPVVRQQVTLPNVIAIPGGLPVKVGDDVIGGAGVSGSPGVDEPCVQAGLDKVAEQLK
jgi:uncharacterized protein GlcG (DUF336 family)